MTIEYSRSIDRLTPNDLSDFFRGWPNPPDEETRFEILKRSHAAWIALDGDRCVGFINALSDGVFYSYIPLLEVLPDYQGRGIGTELVNRMLETLKGMYAVDVVCDEEVASFYERLDFGRCVGMVRRNRGAPNRWIKNGDQSM